MATLLRYVVAIVGCSWFSAALAIDNVVNVYTWAEEIPSFIIDQFEKETGIKVNYSTFDSNEIMYAKLRASKNTVYDLVEPSSYYIDRMRRLGMLKQLNKTQLPNFKHLDPFFLNSNYDPQSIYSVPFVWGVTGIFINKNYFNTNDINRLSDLFNKKFTNQLMFLDDAREVFSMALRLLSYSINDSNPEHIKAAYLKLKELMPNIRLFNNEAVTSILIDEDASVGMVWSGDLFRARKENSQLQFVYPQEGFEIWVDNFAILKDAPHPENAYKFLNFLMRPDIAKAISMEICYATANLTAKNLMPAEIKNNPALYPSYAMLQHGEFETDLDDKTFALIEKYWEKLKMGG